MVLDRWQPTRRLPWRLFRELDEAGRQFDSLFETPLWPAIWRRLPTQEREWSPAIEVFEKEEKYHWSERTYGSFLRTIRLPSNVDTKKIEANYENGMLEITLPKMAEVKPKKITVKPKKGGETGK